MPSTMAKHRIHKSCPFCGWVYVDVKSQQHYGLWHWAQCCNCGARGPRVESRRAALTAWNKTLPRTMPGEPKARPAAKRAGLSLARLIATTRADVPPLRLIGSAGA
ncbi:restriction alleviation protein, Lar family [compost metagenome]